MRLGSLVSMGLFILGAVVLLAQLWFSVWPPEIFIKVAITLGVLFTVSLVLSFVFKEAEETKRLKNGKDL